MSEDLEMEVRCRAFFIWENEGRPEGKHLEHWQRATSEVEAERSQAAAGTDAIGSAPTGTARSNAEV